ncbi:MAG: ACT domain-containing protein [Candidatus Brocadiia bacterium]
MAESGERVIVTAVGQNRPGVLAEITGAIAMVEGNILDISQKMMRNYFNLIMLVDIGPAKVDFAKFKRQLESTGEKHGYVVSVQHEQVFRFMHRI